MKYSDKLNGFWEEGYHYFLEFRGKRLTVRDYRRAVALETSVKYDADAIERGESAVIELADNVLSRTAAGKPFTMIRELRYDGGELKMLYYYTIMGETLYTLHKVDHGPFDHILIRDDEFLDSLQGEWIEWRENGSRDSKLVIKGNKLSWFGEVGLPFHVVSRKTSPDRVYIVPENLIDTSFPGFAEIDVLPDMLTTYMQVCDVSSPMTVFAREDVIDWIEVPEDAKRPARNLMIDRPMVDEPPRAEADE